MGILRERPDMVTEESAEYYDIISYRNTEADLLRSINEFTIQFGAEARLFTENTINYYAFMPSFFICAHNGGIKGVLRLIAPGRHEIKVRALVSPDMRKRGVFRALLKEAISEAVKYGYRRGLFVFDSESPSGRGVMEHWGFEKKHGEYDMVCAPENICICKNHNEIEITKASELDLKEMTQVGTAVFDIDAESERQLLIRSLNTPGRAQWAIKKNGIIIGICGTRIEKYECALLGLCVLPYEQRKGYASELISYLAVYAQKQGVKTLGLSVDTKNEAAIALYRKCGFMIRAETAYYAFGFKKFKKILKKAVRG